MLERTVLVVDDDPVHRMVVEEILTPPKYCVTLASGGADGLTAVADGEVDVVVTDRRMPGMDGLEATRLIRRAVWSTSARMRRTSWARARPAAVGLTPRA